jgi:hypothetical protein
MWLLPSSDDKEEEAEPPAEEKGRAEEVRLEGFEPENEQPSGTDSPVILAVLSWSLLNSPRL